MAKLARIRLNGCKPAWALSLPLTSLNVDLLHERRKLLGQQRPESVPVNTLLLRGALIGSVLPILLLLICGWLGFSTLRLNQKIFDLRPFADEHDTLVSKLTFEKELLDKISDSNKAMARSIVDVRSSSALLAILRRSVPQTVSLSSIKVNGNFLEINGNSLVLDGLKAINSFMLSLEKTRLFKKDSLVLKKANFQQQLDGRENLKVSLAYSIVAEFAPDAYNVIREDLSEFEAFGLQQRLLRVQQEEGLL